MFILSKEFDKKNEALHEMFIQEHQKILEEFNNQRIEMLKKDRLIKKLFNMLQSQEISISEAYINANVAIGETIQKFRESVGMVKKKSRLVIDLVKPPDDYFSQGITLDIADLNNATCHKVTWEKMVEYLGTEFNTLRSVSHSAISKYGQLLADKNKYVKLAKDQKMYYEGELLETRNKMEIIKANAIHSVQKKEKEMRDMKKWIFSELDIKDILIKRQMKYNKILKKELVFSKNIIKNPQLLDEVSKKMNYKKFELVYGFKPNHYYHYKNIDPKLRAKSPQARLKIPLPLHIPNLQRPNISSVSPRTSKFYSKIAFMHFLGLFFMYPD
jgi:hypothetical protein